MEMLGVRIESIPSGIKSQISYKMRRQKCAKTQAGYSHKQFLADGACKGFYQPVHFSPSVMYFDELVKEQILPRRPRRARRKKKI
jgi:hypothetical protein